MSRALIVMAAALIAGCAGSTFMAAPEGGGIIRVSQGEVQGQFTNSEARFCQVTVDGSLQDLPIERIVYEDGKCSVSRGPVGDE